MLVLSVLAILFSYSRADISEFVSCTYTTTNGQCGGTETCTDVCEISPTYCAIGASCEVGRSAYEMTGMQEYGVCFLYGGMIDTRVTCVDSSGGGGDAVTDAPTSASTSGGGGDDAVTDAPTNAGTSGGDGGDAGTDADTSGGGGGSDAGTVAGIVIGCIVGVAVIAVIVYFVYKKKAL